MRTTINLGGLPWHLLLLSWEVDPDIREFIRKEIIRRCPEFEIELDEKESNLIHLASKYGYAEIVKGLIYVSTTDGRVSRCLHRDKYLNTPLDYATMNGNMEVVQLLTEALSSYSANKRSMSMETPRPSDDVPTKVFEALNNLLVSATQQRCWETWYRYNKLEKFLASDSLLFGKLLSRSCPLQTQALIWLLTREIDDRGVRVNKTPYKFEEFLTSDLQNEKIQTDQDKVNIHSMHDACGWGFIHIVKLILIYESGSRSVCFLRNMDGNLPHHCALKNNRANAFKTLLEYYIIRGEFLSNNARDWECGDTVLELLVDGYVKIVKELLWQSGSKICFQREFWEGKEYFLVIKCKKNGSTRTSFKYQDYIRDVTSKTTNRTILSFSVDSRSIITLKVLIRNVVVRNILDVKDVNGKTVFDMLDVTGKVRKTNLMGFVHYERFEKVIWLLDAIEMGDYEGFSKLQAEDPLILDYVCDLPLGGTLLHIAVRFGKLNDCIREIMRKRPLFASRRDHKARNPLHIASSKGNLETVKELLTQFGFNQCFASTHNADEYMEGEFHGTPLGYAIRRGRIPVVNELLSVWWKCVRVVTREANSDLLRIAVENKQFEALKVLMGRYIEDELLKAKEVDGNPMSALADGYIEIITKHLLSPKVNYSLSILEKNIVDENLGTEPSLPLYFVVIKVTSSSRREENNIIDELQLSAYYPKYFREVIVGNKMVLHLSMDDENSVTLKLLLRSPLFNQLDCDDDVFFENLSDKLENKEVVENEMGTLLPIWSNNISDVCRSSSLSVCDNAKEQLGAGIETFHEGTASEEQFSVAAREDYANEEQHEQAMPTDTNIPGNMKGQVFASLDYAAMKGNTELLLKALSSYSANKPPMDTPSPSDDLQTKVFEILDNLLVLAVRWRRWDEYNKLEKFLARDPLLFGTLLSRSCPLQTQFYIWGLSRQTDELLDGIFKTPYKFEEFLASNLQDEIIKSDRDRVNIYPLHDVSKWGCIHIVKLILMYESGSSSVCLLRDKDGNTPLYCALLDKRAKAFKTLLEWYIIHGEFLNNNAGDWECGDTALDLLVGEYIKIVKELLCQSESKICFQREFWVGKKYFVVIKCKNKGNIGTFFTGEVTSKTTNRIIVSISVDSRSIITLKVLIRSAMVRGILDVRNVIGNTVFDLLRQKNGEVIKTNAMGFVPYERYENVIWLLDAIQTGDYEAFCKLQEEDPKILEYVCELPFGGTPLHIAVKFGTLNDCIRYIIRKRPEFGLTKDYKARNPLLIASAKGSLDIVKELLTQIGSFVYIAGPHEDNMERKFLRTPLEYAIERGRISVVNELLPVWWKCIGVAIREKFSSFVRSAVYSKQFEALKMLMERYIEDELLKAKEVDGNPMSALADGYIKIVLNHLLSPKVNYSLLILVKNRGDGKTTGTKLSRPLYFVVIKVLSNSRREDNNIIDELQIFPYYPKYFREVEIQNKMVLHLSKKDDENSVTFKLLLRSPLFYQLQYLTYDTAFDALLDKKDVVENEMGTLIPIWSNKISNSCQSSSINVHDEAKKKIGEGTKNGDEGIVADGNEAAKEYYQNVKADYINDNAEHDTEEPHDQDMLVDGYTVRNQDRSSLWIRQKFASLEECRNAIKDAAILDKTEVIFTKSTSERVVAQCSKPMTCKWIIRAKAESNSSTYVVTEIADEHTCPRLKGDTNKLATAKWVSSHIIDNVRQDHNISTQQIRHIMKQSKFQIDITRKSAERAKEGALDTIHGSQEAREFIKSQYQVDATYEATRTSKKKDLEVMYVTKPKENTIGSQVVLKRRRKSSIASSSLSSNAHQSRSNLRFLEQIPEPMHEFIHRTENVANDGHCGYRVVAIQSGYEPIDGWKQVRRELLIEIVQNEELYVKVMGIDAVAKMRKAFAYFADHATDSQYWLSLHDAGYVIANAYKALVVSLSVNSGNITFLPLLEPPPEGRPLRTITFGFVAGNHFISLNLKPDAPIPQVDRRWDTNVSKAAEVWKTPYLKRFDRFKQIMGFDLGQESNGHCPIILLES